MFTVLPLDIGLLRRKVRSVHIPEKTSHKGNNGRLLIIGGSSLFHSSFIWTAEVSSRIVDIVHYSSIESNLEILSSLKKRFLNGIVVPRRSILDYVEEDDVVLIGPGMLRGEVSRHRKHIGFDDILKISDEALYTYELTKYLLQNFKSKRFVLDAGSLQMLDLEDLAGLQQTPILTPHLHEYKRLFDEDVSKKTMLEKVKSVEMNSLRFNSEILLKGVVDIVSCKGKSIGIRGGNQGLTKGGTGDLLAGLIASFYTKSTAFSSAVYSSFILKLSAEKLFIEKGYWYNIDDLLGKIPDVIKEALLKKDD